MNDPQPSILKKQVHLPLPRFVSRTLGAPWRALKWSFSMRGLRFWLAAFAALVTLFALFPAVENWRGARAWRNYRAAEEAKGAVFDMQALVPPPVPDDQNFAMTPLLKPLLDLYTEEERRSMKSFQPYRDTNGFNRVEAIDLRDVTVAGKVDYPDVTKKTWLGGHRTDLSAWQAYFQASTNFPHASPDATPAEAVLKALSRFDAEFAELHGASKRPYARFNVAYGEDNPMGILLPHLAAIKRLTQVTSLKAMALLVEGESDRALAEMELMFHLSDSIKDEPILISHLVRIACREIILRTIWEGLEDHRWKPEHIARLQTKLTDIHPIADMRQALRGERTFGNGAIEWLIRNPAMLSHIGADDIISGRLPSFTERFGFSLIPRGWFRMEQVNYNKAFDKFIMGALPADGKAMNAAVARRMDDEIEDHIVKVKQPYTAIMHHHVLSGMLLPALGKSYERAVRSHVLVELARVALALESHRLEKHEHPETLDSLTPRFMPSVPVDPFDLKPLRYKKGTDGSFKLWSVGWNGKDDGGQPDVNDKDEAGFHNSDTSTGDWVWPRSKAN